MRMGGELVLGWAVAPQESRGSPHDDVGPSRVPRGARMGNGAGEEGTERREPPEAKFGRKWSG